MTVPIIQVENLGKRYRIGVQAPPTENWRDFIRETVGSTFRYWRQMSRPPTEEETLWALRDVSFEMQPGEVLGIIGRNGAGKSTLLKILSRITDPTEGRAIINGRVGSLLEIGTGFHPELTGRENIYLNGAILGMRRREINRKFAEIVEFAEIDKFIDTPVKRYSSGMHVRLAFAVAAHLEPEILIVDEVLAVGDANFQRKCLGKMEGVASEGRTIIFVSHNMQAVARLCERVIVLDKGQIVQQGDATESIATYFANARSTGETDWTHDLDQAPGNETTRLTSVRVHQGDDEGPKGMLEYSKPVIIEVDYEILEPVQNLTAKIDIVNGDGVLIFGTGDQPYGEFVPRQLGHYRSSCFIPANFMAEGTYYLRVALLEVKASITKHAVIRDALSFTIVDTPAPDSKYGWIVRNHPGVVKPQLNWEIVYDPEAAAVPIKAQIHNLESLPHSES